MTTEVAQVAQSLGFTPETLRACATREEVTRLLDRVKKAYRRRAAILHPDHGGDAEEFKLLAAAYSQIEKSAKSLDFHGVGYRVTSITIITDPVATASEPIRFGNDWWTRAR